MGDVVEALMAAVFRDCGRHVEVVKGVFRKIGATQELDRIFLSMSELKSGQNWDDDDEEAQESDEAAAEETKQYEVNEDEGVAQEAVVAQYGDIPDASGSEDGEIVVWHGEGPSQMPFKLDSWTPTRLGVVLYDDATRSSRSGDPRR